MPERAAEDVLSGIIRIRLGDTITPLPVLAIKPNREWKALANDRLAGAFAEIEKPDANAASIAAFLSGMTDTQIELLYAYDQNGLLPGLEWVESNVTEAQLFSALLAVLAAAFPFVASVPEMLRSSPNLTEPLAKILSGRMSSAQPPTGGAPQQLKGN